MELSFLRIEDNAEVSEDNAMRMNSGDWNSRQGCKTLWNLASGDVPFKVISNFKGGNG